MFYDFELDLSQQFKGYLAVVGAVIFLGSNYLPLKLPSVQQAKIDPVVFQCYSSISIFAFAWLSLLFEPLGYTWWGLASASLGIPAVTLGLISVSVAGVAITQAVCSGTIILVSFFWGAFIFHEEISQWGLTSLGLVFLVIGVIGVSFSNKQWVIEFPHFLRFLYILPWFAEKDHYGSEESFLLLGVDNVRDEYYSYARNPETNSLRKIPKPESNSRTRSKILLGTIIALISGTLTGTVMVPAEFVEEQHQGAIFFFSFGTSAAIVTIAMAGMYFLVRIVLGKGLPEAHLRVGIFPGLITGTLWSLGNACRVYATLYLGLTVGFPLTQLSLIVAALWGMILFQEISRSSAVFVFTFSSCLVVAGAFLLGFYS